MLVELVWPDCTFWGQPDASGVQDAFWCECTAAEAAALRARDPHPPAAEGGGEGTGNWRGVAEPAYHTFLVTRDGGSVSAQPWSYPIASLWNAYNPFRALPVAHVLHGPADLAGIAVPTALRDASSSQA